MRELPDSDGQRQAPRRRSTPPTRPDLYPQQFDLTLHTTYPQCCLLESVPEVAFIGRDLLFGGRPEQVPDIAGTAVP